MVNRLSKFCLYLRFFSLIAFAIFILEQVSSNDFIFRNTESTSAKKETARDITDRKYINGMLLTARNNLKLLKPKLSLISQYWFHRSSDSSRLEDVSIKSSKTTPTNEDLGDHSLSSSINIKMNKETDPNSNEKQHKVDQANTIVPLHTPRNKTNWKDLASRINDSKSLEIDNGSSLPTTDLPHCPSTPPDLIGILNIEEKEVPSFDEQARQHTELQLGGSFRPKTCLAKWRIAIMIPFRSRKEHLNVLLYHLHPFLQKQHIDYTIYVVEQAGDALYNKGMLYNAGFLEALHLKNFDCFVFHDVDLIPENDRNLYTCPEQPRHMSVAVSTLEYKLPYEDIFGGVTAMSVDHYKECNGYSNTFWGWGGEDDDMSHRTLHSKLKIIRYPSEIARYTMLPHKRGTPNPVRFAHLRESPEFFKSDGLNNIKYALLDIQYHRLYTWMYINVLPV